MYGICTQVKPVNAHLNTSSSALAAAMGKNRETASRQTRYYTAVAAHGVAENHLQKLLKEVQEFGTVHNWHDYVSFRGISLLRNLGGRENQAIVEYVGQKTPY